MDRLTFRDARTSVVFCLSAAFIVIGLLFVFEPAHAAALFGIPATDVFALTYVQAIGFRDLALALYLYALAVFSSRRSLALVVACTVLIPVCDAALVSLLTGLSWDVGLHAAGGLVLTLLGLWLGGSLSAEQTVR